MSERSEKFPFLKPGTTITFNSMDEVARFENNVADAVQPIVTPNRKKIWLDRPPIGTVLRPARFNGRITDISLTSLADPYEHLMSARERGHRFLRTPNPSRSDVSRPTERESDEGVNTIPSYVGFEMVGQARSTGRGVIGVIRSELYYYPNIHGALNPSARGNTHAPGAVFRSMTIPEYESDNFTRLHESSRNIAYIVLANELLHPLKGGLPELG